jgi:hypothetical protein
MSLSGFPRTMPRLDEYTQRWLTERRGYSAAGPLRRRPFRRDRPIVRAASETAGMRTRRRMHQPRYSAVTFVSASSQDETRWKQNKHRRGRLDRELQLDNLMD